MNHLVIPQAELDRLLARISELESQLAAKEAELAAALKSTGLPFPQDEGEIVTPTQID